MYDHEQKKLDQFHAMPGKRKDLFSNVTTMQEKAISKLCGQLHVLYNTGSQSHERLIYSMRRTQFYITSLQHY